MTNPWIRALAWPLAAFLLALVAVNFYFASFWDNNPEIIGAHRIDELQRGISAAAGSVGLEDNLKLDAHRVSTGFVWWSVWTLFVSLVLAIGWTTGAVLRQRRVAGPASQTAASVTWYLGLFVYLGLAAALWFLLLNPLDLLQLIDSQRFSGGVTLTVAAGLLIYWLGTAMGASRVMKPSVPLASALV